MLAIDEIRAQGGTLEGVSVEELRMDLRMLDFLIEPESASQDCRDYAIKCVSQANTLGSRRWRMEFLKAFLSGTYFRVPPSGDGAILFHRIATGDHGPFGPPTINKCGKCGHDTDRAPNEIIGWRRDVAVFQVHNSCRLHHDCVDPLGWYFIRGEYADSSLTFGKTQQQTPLI
jgi:hypothetical protein